MVPRDAILERPKGPGSRSGPMALIRRAYPEHDICRDTPQPYSSWGARGTEVEPRDDVFKARFFHVIRMGCGWTCNFAESAVLEDRTKAAGSMPAPRC